MYMKTGNTLPGCECPGAKLHDKTNGNPNNQFCSRLGFLSIFIARQLENYKIRCLLNKGHCKKRKKNTEQSDYTMKLWRLNTWSVSFIESVNFIELNVSSTVLFNTIKCSCFNFMLTLSADHQHENIQIFSLGLLRQWVLIALSMSAQFKVSIRSTGFLLFWYLYNV